MRKTTTFLLTGCLLLYGFAFYAGVAPAAETKGKAADIYKQNCSKCHGEQGKGDGPTTKTIKSMKMTDWTDHAAMAKYTDEDLFKIIKEGGAAANKSKIMPAYKDKLPDQEIRDLVGFIRSLAKK